MPYARRLADHAFAVVVDELDRILDRDDVVGPMTSPPPRRSRSSCRLHGTQERCHVRERWDRAMREK
jgi:hypothetical protein